MAESTLDGGTNNKKNKMAIATGPVTIMPRGGFFMRSKNTKHKKEDGKFHSKNIKHNPAAESARAVFGLKKQGVEMEERK